MQEWIHLEDVILGNSLGLWLAALCSVAAMLLILVTAKRIVRRYLKRRMSPTGLSLPGILYDALTRTRFLFLLIISFYFTTDIISLPPHLAALIRTLSVLAILLQLGFWASYVAALAVRLYFQKDKSDGTPGSGALIVSVALRVLVWTIVTLMALDQLGVNVTTLVAGLGVGGVAIGLATQSILSDLFSSLAILLDKPFKVGDMIGVGDFTGRVERIGLKTTRARSLTGELVVLANGDLLKSRIHNFDGQRERRVVQKLGVAYDTPTEVLAAIPDLLRDVVQARPEARFERANFTAFGDNALVFELVYVVTQTDADAFARIQAGVNLGIHAAFTGRRITFARPS